MSQPEPLSFVAFQTILAELLNLDTAQIKPEAYFITDLGVDSLRMAEVLLRLEELGLELSPDLAWQIQTVGDAYRYYQEQVTGQDL
jgi:acyl carrier protein